jgi:PAS domain S-box-containing protein
MGRTSYPSTEGSASSADLADTDFAAYFENSPHDLFVLDVRPDGEFVFEHINPKLTASTGYTDKMLIGKKPREALTPANTPMLVARYRECVETRQRVEYDVKAVAPIGDVLRHTILVPIVDAAGVVRKILGTSSDVTALRQTEARLDVRTHELQELNERLVHERELSQLIIENTADGVMVVDTALRYLVWNPAIEGIHGKSRHEVLGKTVFEETPGFADHPVGNAWRQAISGERAEIRDFRFFSQPRGAEVIYDADFTPLHAQDGTIVGALCILRETTDRRRVEEMLRQSQKLEAVAQLTGGVAHDFNNLLTSVVGCLDLLAREEHSARAQQHIETAQRSALRGAQLIQQLLAFARRQTLQPVSVDINSLLVEIEALLRRVVDATIEIVIDGLSPLWRCEVDRAQFEAAVMNLVINSRDAMPEGGRIVLRTFNVHAKDIPVDANLRPGDYVALTVEDAGEGMSAETAARAFDPFFTTKEPGKGTGLGLSMVYGFATQSGGGLRLETALGVGTRVTLFFPRDRSAADEIGPPVPAGEPSRGAGSVLVVEDDKDVRELSVEMLGGLGYRVLVACDGHEALEILKGRDAIGLLFTDLVMPGGLSGSELAREARRLRPGLPVLLTTGYAGTQTELAGEFPLIAKPFRLAELSRAVAQLIDHAPG